MNSAGLSLFRAGYPSEKLDFQAVIKSAASAASPKTKIQESREASGRRLGMRTARLPWTPGFWSSGRLRYQPT